MMSCWETELLLFVCRVSPGLAEPANCTLAVLSASWTRVSQWDLWHVQSLLVALPSALAHLAWRKLKTDVVVCHYGMVLEVSNQNHHASHLESCHWVFRKLLETEVESKYFVYKTPSNEHAIVITIVRPAYRTMCLIVLTCLLFQF